MVLTFRRCGVAFPIPCRLLVGGYLSIIKFNINNFYLISIFIFFSRVLRTIRCLLLFTGKEFLLEWELLQISGVKISLILVLDFISVLFFSTVIIIAGRVFLYRGSYMMIDIVGHRFSWLVFSFVVSICMLIFRPNIIRVLLG